MDRQVNCTGCGAVGTVAPCDDIIFQSRGFFQGKSVVKCMKCGCGMLFGPFSGVFFGKPKLIPDESWCQMEQMWQDSALPYISHGSEYAAKGEYNKALNNFNLAIRINPNNAAAYTGRGLAYYQPGNMGKAISDFQKACDMGDVLGCEYLQIVLENR